MLLYSHEDVNPIPYTEVFDEFTNLKIVVCPMRITEPGYDGQFISYITNKLKAFDAIDRIIVDDFTEAIPLAKVEQLINRIESECGIPRNNIVFVNGGEEIAPNVIAYPTFYDISNGRLLGYQNNNVVPWPIREKLLISLSRRPCWFRVAITEELIKRNLLEHSIVSCGTDSTFGDDGWINLFAKPDYYKYFPMTVDGTITREEEYTSNGLEFSSAYINLVSESSHNVFPFRQSELQRYINECNSVNAPDGLHQWERVFVTEKTIKAIAMQQIPIFNTVKHHVRHLRSIGLDLFDDIVDHGYDNIDDPIERIQAVAVQVETAYNRGFDYFRSIPNIEQRLAHNYQCIKTYYAAALEVAHNQIKEFLNHGHVTL